MSVEASVVDGRLVADGVTEIPAGAYVGRTDIKEVVLPASVVKIGTTGVVPHGVSGAATARPRTSVVSIEGVTSAGTASTCRVSSVFV